MDIEGDLELIIDEQLQQLQQLQQQAERAVNTALPESDDDVANSLLQEFDSQ